MSRVGFPCRILCPTRSFAANRNSANGMSSPHRQLCGGFCLSIFTVLYSHPCGGIIICIKSLCHFQPLFLPILIQRNNIDFHLFNEPVNFFMSTDEEICLRHPEEISSKKFPEPLKQAIRCCATVSDYANTMIEFQYQKGSRNEAGR